jgi:hypothetical protein
VSFLPVSARLAAAAAREAPGEGSRVMKKLVILVFCAGLLGGAVVCYFAVIGLAIRAGM